MTNLLDNAVFQFYRFSRKCIDRLNAWNAEDKDTNPARGALFGFILILVLIAIIISPYRYWREKNGIKLCASGVFRI